MTASLPAVTLDPVDLAHIRTSAPGQEWAATYAVYPVSGVRQGGLLNERGDLADLLVELRAKLPAGIVVPDARFWQSTDDGWVYSRDRA